MKGGTRLPGPIFTRGAAPVTPCLSSGAATHRVPDRYLLGSPGEGRGGGCWPGHADTVHGTPSLLPAWPASAPRTRHAAPARHFAPLCSQRRLVRPQPSLSALLQVPTFIILIVITKMLFTCVTPTYTHVGSAWFPAALPRVSLNSLGFFFSNR